LNLDRLHPDAARLRARVRVGGIMDELEAAVRHELGADRIQLGTAPLQEDTATSGRA
jgi:hypothetical protein